MTSVAEGPLSGQLPPDITHQANGRFGRRAVLGRSCRWRSLNWTTIVGPIAGKRKLPT